MFAHTSTITLLVSLDVTSIAVHPRLINREVSLDVSPPHKLCTSDLPQVGGRLRYKQCTSDLHLLFNDSYYIYPITTFIVHVCMILVLMLLRNVTG